MKQTKNILAIIGLTTIAIQTAFAQSSYREPNTKDKVIGYAKHIKLNNIKRIEYSFNVINNSYTIYGIEIGQKSVVDDEPAIDFGDDDSRNFIYKSPKANWIGKPAHLPESYKFSFYWDAPSGVPETYNEAEFLLPNKTYTSFGVTTFKRYPSIWNTFVEFKIYEPVNHQIIKLTKGDTIAPTASLAATLVKHPTKTGFYNVNLKVTAKDNYDPLPEIVFTSVQDMSTATKNTSPFNAGAYTLNTPNNVTTGAYPSIITFTADANTAKQYKINYTVTDASDNKTDVSTTVTVPKR